MPRPLSSIKQETHASVSHDAGGDLASDEELGTPDTIMPSNTPASGVDSMRNVVKQTVPNPLAGPARKEFKKIAAKLSTGGEGIFNTIDTDVMTIMDALSNIAEATYDSYSKLAAKSVAAESEAAAAASAASTHVTGMPSVLAAEIAKGAEALDQVETLKGHLNLMMGALDEYKNLYQALHDEFSGMVEDCSNSVKSRILLSTASVEKRRLILERCTPAYVNSNVEVKGGNPPERFVELAKKCTEMGTALRDYKAMQDFMIKNLAKQKRTNKNEAMTKAAAMLAGEEMVGGGVGGSGGAGVGSRRGRSSSASSKTEASNKKKKSGI
jgi:hypothetical protein